MTAEALDLFSGKAFKEDLLPLTSEVHFVLCACCYHCTFGRSSDSCHLECAPFVDHVLEDPHFIITRDLALKAFAALAD